MLSFPDSSRVEATVGVCSRSSEQWHCKLLNKRPCYLGVLIFDLSQVSFVTMLSRDQQQTTSHILRPDKIWSYSGVFVVTLQVSTSKQRINVVGARFCTRPVCCRMAQQMAEVQATYSMNVNQASPAATSLITWGRDLTWVPIYCRSTIHYSTSSLHRILNDSSASRYSACNEKGVTYTCDYCCRQFP